MSFKAGAIVGNAYLETKGWDKGVDHIDKSSKKLTSAIKTAAKVGLSAFAVATGVATFKAMQFDKAMRNVSTLVEGTPDDFNKMRDSIIDMDVELGKSTDLASGLYQAISAGAKPGQEAMDLVKQSAMFATAALTDTNIAVDIITTAINAYGKETMNAAKASDLFFNTIKQGKITGEQLSAVIGQSIPLFASAGISMEELSSGIATMTKQGVQASEATTQMNAIVNAFLKPSQEMSIALRDIGYESGAAFIETEGLSGAMEFLEKKTGGEKDKLAELLPNIRALKGALALTGQGAEIFNETLVTMGDVTDSTSEAFKKQLDPVTTALNTFDKLAVVAGKAGEVFLDELAVAATETAKSMIEFFKSAETMDTLKEMAQDLAGAVIDLAKFIGNLVMTIVDLPGPLKAAVTAGIALTIVVPKIITGFQLMKAAVIAFNASAMMGPTGLIVLAGAAAAALVKLGIDMRNESTAMKQQKEESIKLNAAYSDVNKEAVDMAKNVAGIKKEFNDFNIAVTGGTPAINMLEKLESQLNKVEKEITDTEIALGKSSLSQEELAVKQMESYRNLSFLNNAQSQYNKALNQGIDEKDAMALATEGLEQKLKDSKKARYELKLQIDRIRKALKNEKNDITNNTESIEDNTDKLKDNRSEFEKWVDDKKFKMKGLSDFLKKSFTSTSDFIEGIFRSAIQGIQWAFDSISNISSQHFINENAKLDNQILHDTEKRKEKYESDRNALDEQYENNLLTDAEYNEQSTALETKYQNDIEKLQKDANKKKNDLAKKQFENEKKFSIANVWIDAATGIMDIWSKYAWNPITAGLLSGAVFGMAIKQSSLIKKQQFVPQYAKGTDYHPGGLAIVGEKGPELIDMPVGTGVHTNAETMKYLNDNNKNISIHINNPTVRKESDIKKIADAVSNILGRQLRMA